MNLTVITSFFLGFVIGRTVPKVIQRYLAKRNNVKAVNQETGNTDVWYWPVKGTCPVKSLDSLESCEWFTHDPFETGDCVFRDDFGNCHSKEFK